MSVNLAESIADQIVTMFKTEIGILDNLNDKCYKLKRLMLFIYLHFRTPIL